MLARLSLNSIFFMWFPEQPLHFVYFHRCICSVVLSKKDPYFYNFRPTSKPLFCRAFKEFEWFKELESGWYRCHLRVFLLFVQFYLTYELMFLRFLFYWNFLLNTVSVWSCNNPISNHHIEMPLGYWYGKYYTVATI